MKAADARAFGPRCAADGGFKPREGRVGSGPLALAARLMGDSNPRKRRAGSRPAAFRYVAVATYSSEKIRA